MARKRKTEVAQPQLEAATDNPLSIYERITAPRKLDMPERPATAETQAPATAKNTSSESSEETGNKRIDPNPLSQVQSSANMPENKAVQEQPTKKNLLAGINEQRPWTFTDGGLMKPDGTLATRAETVRYMMKGDQETPEEKKKRERREKWGKIASAMGDGIYALSNLFFTTKGAPNMYKSGSETLSGTTHEQYERLAKERKADADKYNTLLLNAVYADKGDKTAADKWRDQLAEWEKKRKAAEQAAKDKAAGAAAAARAKATADADKTDANNRTKVEVAKIREEGATKRAGINAQTRISIAGGKASGGSKAKIYRVNLGEETIDIPTEAINDAAISKIYALLPEDVRKQALQDFGEPIYTTDVTGAKEVTGRKALSKEQMLAVIGANMDGNENIENEFRALAGQKPKPASPNSSKTKKKIEGFGS